jgi:hypothetical protein
VRPTPKTGRVKVSPFQGQALFTVFTLEALDWIVRNNPAEYQFLYEDSNGYFSPISQFQRQSSLTTRLPPTNKVMVKVRD